MPEILTTLASAFSTAQKLKEIGDKIKDADLRNLVADLNLELANIKTQLADVTDENRQLKAKVLDLESTEGEQCPKCKKRGWQLESSHPDPTFGELGGVRRTYKCSLCGFSENKLITS